MLHDSVPFCPFSPLPFSLMAIQQCELVLIHIYPQGEDTLVTDRPKKEVNLCHPVRRAHRSLLTRVFLRLSSQISPLLTSEVHSVRAGRHLATKLNILVQQHFDLGSTTITNIPMKVKWLQLFSCLWTCLK